MAAAKSVVAIATHRPRKLISAWLFLSSFVVAWDIGYILMRPRSFLGGDLHWLWSPYSLYMNIDYVYGLPSWDAKDGFPAAQTLMNVLESILNLFYVYLVHVRATPSSRAVAPIYGLITVTMTLSKTILYVLNVSSPPHYGREADPLTFIARLVFDGRTTAAAGARLATTTGTRSSSTGSFPTVFGSSSPPSSPTSSSRNSPRRSKWPPEFKVRPPHPIHHPPLPLAPLLPMATESKRRRRKRYTVWQHTALTRIWLIIRSSRAGHRTTHGS